jgi:uncharacterized membrane protein
MIQKVGIVTGGGDCLRSISRKKVLSNVYLVLVVYVLFAFYLFVADQILNIDPFTWEPINKELPWRETLLLSFFLSGILLVICFAIKFIVAAFITKDKEKE